MEKFTAILHNFFPLKLCLSWFMFLLEVESLFFDVCDVCKRVWASRLSRRWCLHSVSVFQDRPKLPPTQAQATARSIPPEQYSYSASILRLLRNKPFILLIITYGRSRSPQSTSTFILVMI